MVLGSLMMTLGAFFTVCHWYSHIRIYGPLLPQKALSYFKTRCRAFGRDSFGHLRLFRFGGVGSFDPHGVRWQRQQHPYGIDSFGDYDFAHHYGCFGVGHPRRSYPLL